MTGKHKKSDRQKRGLKLFFFPKAQGQKHKHKKNKYYVSQDDWSPTGSVMSGDSPAHHNRTAEVFDFNQSSPNQAEGRPQLLDSKPLGADGRSSPIATTSKDVAVQSNTTDDKVGDKQGKGEVQASVLVEPGGGKDKDDDDEHFGSPTLNNSEARERGKDEERRGKNDEGFGGRDKKDRKDDKFRKNGNIDKLDGVWVPKDEKQQEDGEEDNCIVKCLYVTLTCCECSIM